MVSGTIAAKDPAKVRAGELGARKRWGDPRVLRLDELTSEQRRLVLALVDAAKKAPAPVKADAVEDGDATADPRQRAA